MIDLAQRSFGNPKTSVEIAGILIDLIVGLLSVLARFRVS
jgi:hypothetical protein